MTHSLLDLISEKNLTEQRSNRIDNKKFLREFLTRSLYFFFFFPPFPSFHLDPMRLHSDQILRSMIELTKIKWIEEERNYHAIETTLTELSSSIIDENHNRNFYPSRNYTHNKSANICLEWTNRSRWNPRNGPLTYTWSLRRRFPSRLEHSHRYIGMAASIVHRIGIYGQTRLEGCQLVTRTAGPRDPWTQARRGY